MVLGPYLKERKMNNVRAIASLLNPMPGPGAVWEFEGDDPTDQASYDAGFTMVQANGKTKPAWSAVQNEATRLQGLADDHFGEFGQWPTANYGEGAWKHGETEIVMSDTLDATSDVSWVPEGDPIEITVSTNADDKVGWGSAKGEPFPSAVSGDRVR